MYPTNLRVIDAFLKGIVYNESTYNGRGVASNIAISYLKIIP
jgi:hypothetical protein